MGCFAVACFGALFGRFAVLILWIIGWFGNSGITTFWLVVGFIFAPMTLMCVGCVNTYFGGHWGVWQIIALILCLLMDFGGDSGSASRSSNQ
ncbi:hypothetical protein DRJ17_03515 [Candidatus Woesearchaeota archaeon]|nr:MAG: hypothetical protein DRJ17_03515 [Candidatus Woesearchaeota archaeon]